MVSVVIPVFNDTRRLLKAIRALSNQTYPKNRYEIIVIDNGSEIDVRPFLNSFEQIVFSREKQAGAFPARNRGISLSKGDIIAFTDSDCIPNHDWIERGVESFLGADNCGLVAGRIDVFYIDPEHPTAIELYDHLMALPQRNFLEKERYGATANLFVPRTVFRELGLFNAMHKSEGGDAELGYRTSKAGLIQLFCDKAVVKHPARNTLTAIIKKGLRTTIGTQVTIEKYNYKGRSFLQYVIHHLFQRPRELNVKMSVSPFCAGWRMRLKVISLYYLIKSLQVVERLRVKLAGDTIR